LALFGAVLVILAISARRSRGALLRDSSLPPVDGGTRGRWAVQRWARQHPQRGGVAIVAVALAGGLLVDGASHRIIVVMVASAALALGSLWWLNRA
jgi:hypothetical protein